MTGKRSGMCMLCASVVGVLLVVCLCGCVTDTETGDDLSRFFGTWTGSIDIAVFGGENSTITELVFSKDSVTTTLTTQQESIPISFTYTVDGDRLTFEPSMNRNGGFPGGQPFTRNDSRNFTRPSGNESWLQNGTQPPLNGSYPPNGTQPPGNGSWPPNNNGQQPGRERFSMQFSFTYRFNDDYTVVYLNDSEFIKRY